MPRKTLSLFSRSRQSRSEFRHLQECHCMGQIMNTGPGIMEKGHHLSLGSQGGDTCVGCRRRHGQRYQQKQNGQYKLVGFWAARVFFFSLLAFPDSEVKSAVHRELPRLAIPVGIFSPLPAGGTPDSDAHHHSYLKFCFLSERADSSVKWLADPVRCHREPAPWTQKATGSALWLCCYGNQWFSCFLVRHRP